MKMLRHTLIGLMLLPCITYAFQIDLPKHYHDDLEKKRLAEAEIIWREIDRAAVESEIRAFIERHPSVDGVDLRESGNFEWSRDDRAINCGPWQVFLAEWELNFPKLQRIRWTDAMMVISLAYDWKEKVAKEGGDGEVRLYFSVSRNGGLFKKRVIHPRFEHFDYGELYILLPFGGVELKRTNRPASTDPGQSP
jgi:hypothetical protein